MTAVLDDILVVEDDRDMNELVGAYAQIDGYQYRQALTAGTAMDEVRRQHPSLIILDLMLPDRNGLEVCRQLKSDQATRDIPVVILTALDGEDSRRAGRECGAEEYLTKPFNPEELLEAIRRHARRNGRDGAAADSR